MAAVREQLAAAPAEIVVANHLMGLYNLLQYIFHSNHQNWISFYSYRCHVGGMILWGGRLGEAEGIKDALHQIRLAYVQIGNQEDTPKRE